MIEGFAADLRAAAARRPTSLQVPQPGLSARRRSSSPSSPATSRSSATSSSTARKVVTAIAVAPRRPLRLRLERKRGARRDRAAENEALRPRPRRRCRRALRQANTTFVNLRAALDDLDPLVAASLVGTRDLAPFLRRPAPRRPQRRPGLQRPAPDAAAPGPRNDLNDILKDLPSSSRSAATRPSPRRSRRSTPRRTSSAVARPYTPDLLGWSSRSSAR